MKTKEEIIREIELKRKTIMRETSTLWDEGNNEALAIYRQLEEILYIQEDIVKLLSRPVNETKISYKLDDLMLLVALLMFAAVVFGIIYQYVTF